MEPLTRSVQHQRGTALFVALIMLVAMSVTAVSLVRSVDTTVVITGNLAFQQSALQVADYGVEAAASDLGWIRTNSADSQWRRSNTCSVASGAVLQWNYYPLSFDRATQIGNPINMGYPIAGVPNVDWTRVPCVENPRIPTGYFVQYVMDRMCTGSLPVLDLARNCASENPQEGGSRKAGSTRFTGAGSILYRVTIRVIGPNNAQSFVQVMLRD